MKPEFTGRRTVIIGVGNEFRGDDAAGIMAIRSLMKLLAARGIGFLQPPILEQKLYETKSLFLIEGGPAPENYSGAIRLFQPEAVVLIDAADMGLKQGQFSWVEWGQVSGFGGSTHTSSLSMFAEFLRRECQCVVFILGIQPSQFHLHKSLSAPARMAVKTIAAKLADELTAK